MPKRFPYCVRLPRDQDTVGTNFSKLYWQGYVKGGWHRYGAKKEHAEWCLAKCQHEVRLPSTHRRGTDHVKGKNHAILSSLQIEFASLDDATLFVMTFGGDISRG